MPTIYHVANAALPTTAISVAVATGTAIKTLLQVTAASTRDLEIVEWGISMDGSPDLIAELVHTTTVAGGSPTAVVPTVWSDSRGNAALSTAGFSPSTEGTVAATVRMFDLQSLRTNTYVKQFPLGERPMVPASGVVRIRVDAATGANALCYMMFCEV